VAVSSGSGLDRKQMHEDLHNESFFSVYLVTIQIYLILLAVMPKHVGVTSVTVVILMIVTKGGM
jgi:hypothetical protein